MTNSQAASTLSRDVVQQTDGSIEVHVSAYAWMREQNQNRNASAEKLGTEVYICMPLRKRGKQRGCEQDNGEGEGESLVFECPARNRDGVEHSNDDLVSKDAASWDRLLRIPT